MATPERPEVPKGICVKCIISDICIIDTPKKSTTCSDFIGHPSGHTTVEVEQLATLLETNKAFRAEAERLKAEVKEQDDRFGLGWDASMRGVKKWQEANPGNDLTWPDKCDFTSWMLDELATLRAEVEKLKAENEELRKSIHDWVFETDDDVKKENLNLAAELATLGKIAALAVEMREIVRSITLGGYGMTDESLDILKRFDKLKGAEFYLERLEGENDAQQ